MELLSIWIAAGTVAGLVAISRHGKFLGNILPAYLMAFPLAVGVADLAHNANVSQINSVHDGAMLLQRVVSLAFIGLLVLLFAARRPSSGPHAGLYGRLVALAGTYVLYVEAFLPIDSTTSTPVLIASSTVVVLGTAFAFWGLVTLGRCFGVFPEVRGLVLRGPYRLVRHPAYFGEMISAVGLLLSRPHLLTVILLATFLVLQYWRTAFEERVLIAAFPVDYPRYRTRVPRLIPGPWRRQSVPTRPRLAIEVDRM